jgi:hypothetical protein
MVHYSLEQRVFLYDTYVKYGSAGKFWRTFRRKFRGERVSSRQTIHNLLNKIRTTGLLIGKKQKYKLRVPPSPGAVLLHVCRHQLLSSTLPSTKSELNCCLPEIIPTNYQTEHRQGEARHIARRRFRLWNSGCYRFLAAQPGFQHGSVQVRFVVDTASLGEEFCFPCQFSYNLVLHVS